MELAGGNLYCDGCQCGRFLQSTCQRKTAPPLAGGDSYKLRLLYDRQFSRSHNVAFRLERACQHFYLNFARYHAAESILFWICEKDRFPANTTTCQTAYFPSSIV